VNLAVAKLEEWTDKLQGAGDGDSGGGLAALADRGLDELADGGGAAMGAGVAAVGAVLHGDNPVIAAIKGAWRAGTPAVRAAIITAAVAAVLLLLLSPVLFIIFLLSLLVLAAVQRSRAARPAKT
jgi:hypothetical protein